MNPITEMSKRKNADNSSMANRNEICAVICQFNMNKVSIFINESKAVMMPNNEPIEANM